MVAKALARIVGAMMAMSKGHGMNGNCAELFRLFVPKMETVCNCMSPNPHEKTLRLARSQRKKMAEKDERNRARLERVTRLNSQLDLQKTSSPVPLSERDKGAAQLVPTLDQSNAWLGSKMNFCSFRKAPGFSRHAAYVS